MSVNNVERSLFRARYIRLTRRQRECLGAMCAHDCRKEAARSLYLSDATLRNHMTHAYKTLGTPSAARACYLLGRMEGVA
jgi:DNA-binding CsgD family transcriptional regulator